MKHLKLYEEYEYRSFISSETDPKNPYILFLVLGSIYGDYKNVDISDYNYGDFLTDESSVEMLHKNGYLMDAEGNLVANYNDEDEMYLYYYETGDSVESLVCHLEAMDLKGWTNGEFEFIFYIKKPEYKILNWVDIEKMKTDGYVGDVYMVFNRGVEDDFDSESIYDHITTEEDLEKLIEDSYCENITDKGIDSLLHNTFNINTASAYSYVLEDDSSSYYDDFFYYIYDSRTMELLESGGYGDYTYT